jgi:hypothetical protein
MATNSLTGSESELRDGVVDVDTDFRRPEPPPYRELPYGVERAELVCDD